MKNCQYIRNFNAVLHSVSQGRVHSSTLFIGGDAGLGIRFSLKFAKKNLCLEPVHDVDDCKCLSCMQFDKLSHPDLFFLYPLSGGTTNEEWKKFILDFHIAPTKERWQQISDKNIIPKEKIYELLTWLTIRASVGEKKGVFIFCPEDLNAHAANALLKTLEEPMGNTFFVLYSEDKSKVIPTILSRCSQINFSGDKKAKLNGALSYQEESSDISKNSPLQNFQMWMRFCYMKDFRSLVNFSGNLNSASKNFQKEFFKYSIEILNFALKFSLEEEYIGVINREERHFLEKFSSKINAKDILIENVKILLKYELYLSQNINVKFLFMDMSFKLFKIF